jgi:hypothetical protein
MKLTKREFEEAEKKFEKAKEKFRNSKKDDSYIYNS